MKAAVLEELEKIRVKEVPDRAPGPGEIKLRVRACAVCGSDVRIFHHGNQRVKLPAVVGHEVGYPVCPRPTVPPILPMCRTFGGRARS